MLIDDFMASYDFNEVHTIMVRASPARAYRAIKEMTPAEVPAFRALMAIRALPARIAGRRPSRRYNVKRSLLEQVVGGGFVLLAEEPGRELVLGLIGQFWKLTGGSFPRTAGPEEFRAFDRPDHAKAVINFHVGDPQPDGTTRVRTETRIQATDPKARRKFAAYWRVIYPGSALIRKSWLRAIEKRAERSP
jgi:hypothetical protein